MNGIERSLHPSMDREIVAAIDRRLDDVRAQDGVAIPLAVESGSRAWGFPSPDSDYDCRFVYIRPLDAYLSPWPQRDVIETPLDDIFDVNGWDIGKAVKLLAGGNAVIVEWLTSPIVYGAETAFKTAFLDLAKRIVRRDLVAYHYLSLGMAMWKRVAVDPNDVALKKIFYALRPAAALRWLRMQPDEAVAPMHFPSLMEQCDLPSDLRDEIDELLLEKSKTRELGRGPVPARIATFLQAEFESAERLVSARSRASKGPVNREAEEFFRDMVRRYGK